ncbi:MAG: hypothetical protein ACKOWF_13855 [Chloroflexota bacterium]
MLTRRHFPCSLVLAAVALAAAGGIATERLVRGEEDAPPGTAEPGATLRISGLAVTVRGGERMGSYGYTYAAEGATLLVIEAKIVNERAAPVETGAGAFSAVGIGDRAAWPAIRPVAIGLLEDATLAPGESASGRVVIEVPAGAGLLLVRFSAGLFDPAVGYWRVPTGPAAPAASPAASPVSSHGRSAAPSSPIPL